MNKRVLAVLLAVVLAIVGVLFVVVYAKNADKRAAGGAELVTVYQVQKTISAGTAADQLGDAVVKTRLPRKAVVKGAVDDLGDLDGLSSTVQLQAGEQLIQSRFAKDGVVVGDAEASVPKGYQELTLPLSEARVVGGVIKPGDRVGLYGSDEIDGDGYTTVVEHQVLVLRIRALGATKDGGVASSSNNPEGANYLVTVAVKTQSAIFAIGFQEFGKIWLTKQNDNTEKGAWPELGKLPFSKVNGLLDLALKDK